MSLPPDDSENQSYNRLNSGSARFRPQTAWGLPAQTTSRRALGNSSINTISSGTDSAARRPGSASSPSVQSSTASSWVSAFPAISQTSRTNNSRHNSSASSSTASFTPLQLGLQQLASTQQQSSPRSRTNTPSSNSALASSTAAATGASQVGGGGSGGSGGGLSKTGNFSPASSAHGLNSPTNTTFERNPFSSSNLASGGTGQSSVSKITVTQIFLLLGSITEKEGKVKWEAQAEAIRKVRNLYIPSR